MPNLTPMFGLADPRVESALLRRAVVEASTIPSTPSAIRVVVLGPVPFAQHVFQHFSSIDDGVDSPRDASHTPAVSAELQLLSDQHFTEQTPAAIRVDAEIVICDWQWWRSHRQRRVIWFQSRDGRPPALLAHSLKHLTPEEWNNVEHRMGAFLVGCTESSLMPPIRGQRLDLLCALGRRAGRFIGERIVESLASQGELDAHDPCIGAIQLALTAPECFASEAKFAAAADSLRIDARSPEPERDGLARAKWRSLRSKKLQRRFAELGLFPPMEFVDLCRLLHGLFRYHAKQMLCPRHRVNLGDLAKTLGVAPTSSRNAARRKLNDLAKRHFLGCDFLHVVERLRVHDTIDVLGGHIAGAHWIRSAPLAIPISHAQLIGNESSIREWVIRLVADHARKRETDNSD